MKAYATPADLGTYLNPALTGAEATAAGNEYAASMFGDATADRVLLRATQEVESHVLTGYVATADGLPVDDDLAAWLRDAACAQVEFWGLVSEEHGIAGIGGTLSAEGMSHMLPGRIGPRALYLLDLAGVRSPIGGHNAYHRTPLELIGRTYSRSA